VKRNINRIINYNGINDLHSATGFHFLTEFAAIAAKNYGIITHNARFVLSELSFA